MALTGVDLDFMRPEVCTKSQGQNWEGCSQRLARSQPSEGPCGVGFSSCKVHLFLRSREMLGSDFLPPSLTLVYKVGVLSIPMSWICGEDGLKQFMWRSSHNTWHGIDN